MKKLLYTLLLLLTLFTSAQTYNIIPSLASSKSIEADEYIGEDNTGFLYFIKNNTLFKTKNAEKYQYKNISLGKITRVDLQNPLRILLFFENFNIVIALDNQLNEVQKLDFNNIDNTITLSAAGTSALNNYWIFNQNNQQLLRYNYTKNTTQPIGVTFEKPIKDYFCSYNEFLWIDTTNHLYQCNFFGKRTFITQIPEYDKIALDSEKNIIYQKNGTLFLYAIQTQKTYLIENIKNSIISFHYKNQNLAIFTAQEITNYKIILP
ncbi:MULTISPECIES: hypothetical protein [Flavobacterium]|uniref:Uncharacterized protein n=2 Tax=Flavobacterium TaxID=237 RepID=A0ABW8PNV4_9FLAO|nr:MULTISPECIES: hypothetical protein [Flavobacterium]QYS89777.1 hypothetical protein JJC05_06065 [Flavobacterium davisii]SPE76744.1 hypothetical protein FLACOL_00733 [Flavobacterium columnare]